VAEHVSAEHAYRAAMARMGRLTEALVLAEARVAELESLRAGARSMGEVSVDAAEGDPEGYTGAVGQAD
jgi:hypothetical protein